MTDKTLTAGKTLPRELLHPRFWPTWIAIGVFFLISLLPIALLDAIGVRLGHLLVRKNRKRYEIVKTNLTLCFPDKGASEIEQMVISHFEFLMRSIMHYGLVWWASEKRLRKLLKLEGFEQVKQLQDQGQNVIVLLSHCTGLEFAVSAISQNFPGSGPYKPLGNPVIDWLVAKARQRFNDGLAFRREEGLRPIIKQAKQGRVIIYLADEDLGPDVSLFAPFFGIPKATIPVLGRLAHACKAKVLPAFSCYDPVKRHYKVTLFPPMAEFPTLDQQKDTELMNNMIESTVNSCPTQYFWTLKMFKTRPDNEQPYY